MRHGKTRRAGDGATKFGGPGEEGWIGLRLRAGQELVGERKSG